MKIYLNTVKYIGGHLNITQFRSSVIAKCIIRLNIHVSYIIHLK